MFGELPVKCTSFERRYFERCTNVCIHVNVNDCTVSNLRIVLLEYVSIVGLYNRVSMWNNFRFMMTPNLGEMGKSVTKGPCVAPQQSAYLHWKQSPTPFSGKRVVLTYRRWTKWISRFWGTFNSDGFLHFLQDQLPLNLEDISLQARIQLARILRDFTHFGPQDTMCLKWYYGDYEFVEIPMPGTAL
jgi:hypothetical protein